MTNKNKVAICATIVLCTALMGSSCEGKDTEIDSEGDFSVQSVQYVVDQETGVNYVYYSSHGGITPRLNADGSLYVSDVNPKGN